MVNYPTGLFNDFLFDALDTNWVFPQVRKFSIFIWTVNDAGRYAAGAALVCLIWDQLLSIADEVELVWSAPLSVMKVIYYWTRTVVPAFLIWSNWMVNPYRTAQLDPSFCRVWLYLAMFLTNISFTSIDWMFVLRVVALYESRIVHVIVRVIFWATWCVTFWGGTVYGVYWNNVYGSRESCPAILMSGGPKQPFPTILWSAAVFFDTVAFTLTIWRIGRMWKFMGLDQRPRLFYILLRDGSVWFLIIICMRVFNVIVMWYWLEGLEYFAWFGMWSLLTLIFSRTFLNLKSAAGHEMMNLESQLTQNWLRGLNTVNNKPDEADVKKRLPGIDEEEDDEDEFEVLDIRRSGWLSP